MRVFLRFKSLVPPHFHGCMSPMMTNVSLSLQCCVPHSQAGEVEGGVGVRGVALASCRDRKMWGK